jgi:hypothetical protein
MTPIDLAGKGDGPLLLGFEGLDAHSLHGHRHDTFFGVDFREHLGRAVAQRDILLAVIGDAWIGCCRFPLCSEV